MRGIKQRLRREVLARREAIGEQARAEGSTAISRRLFDFPPFRRAHRIALFWGVRSEVETAPIVEQALALGKRIALPVTLMGERRLRLREICGEDGELQAGPMEIPQPAERCPEVAPPEIELVVVPAVAFDPEGYRLGYGGGFYDRLLAKMGALKVGIAFESQLVERVPRDQHDLPVDWIITDQRLIECRQARQRR